MKKTRVMVFGTFDGVHKGHLSLFKQARQLAKRPFLIVVVARDKNVFKIKKRKTLNNEKKRILLVKKSDFPDKVILGKMNDYFGNILKEKPGIIALGYDQKTYVNELRKDLKKIKMDIQIVRLKPYKKHNYKNSLLHIAKTKRDK